MHPVGRAIRKVDLAKYNIQLFTIQGRLCADVGELPGSVATAKNGVDLQIAIEQAIYVYLDDHPDAPRHYT